MDKDSDPSIDSTADTVLYYYNRSMDDNLSKTKQQQAIDKAYYLAKKNDKNALYGKVLYQKSSFSNTSGKYDSLLIYDKLLRDYVTQGNDVSILARQHYLMGFYYDKIPKLPDSAFIRYCDYVN
ncbi:hypothetical protein D2V05_06165 [Flagellimonas pelagia]|uniref:Uncharacterized protein n=1 Tax=Flagellimonas pelagia TaxID=2306998 RepID=A0A3A1NIT3_9FLAO|nr:hypothetical protein D2V05_06165 [Allomuricauda maritima]